VHVVLTLVVPPLGVELLNLVFVLNLTDSSRQCWCFGSNGLQALGQRELVFLLECLLEEKTLPRDFFTLYLSVYEDALKGRNFTHDVSGSLSRGKR